jgi:hypothetical protein
MPADAQYAGWTTACGSPTLWPIKAYRKGEFMTKAISIALIVGGIVLLYFGGQAFNSVSSEVSRVFTGSPTNKAILLIVGGVIATIAGLTGMAVSGRKR